MAQKGSGDEISKIQRRQDEVASKMKRIDNVLKAALGMKKLSKDELEIELPNLLTMMPKHLSVMAESNYVTIDSECQENLKSSSCVLQHRMRGSKTPQAHAARKSKKDVKLMK